MKQLELPLNYSQPEPKARKTGETGLMVRPLSNYLAALGLLRLVPDLQGYWQGDRFWVDRDLDEVIDYLFKSYQPSPIFTPWNKSGGWFKETKQGKTYAPWIEEFRQSQGDRFALLREAIATIDREYQRATDEGFFQNPNMGDYAKHDKDKNDKYRKKVFVTRLRANASPSFLHWIDTVYAFLPDALTTIAIAGKAGNDGVEYSKVFAETLRELFDKSGAPKPDSRMALQALLCGETAIAFKKISPGLYSPNSGGLNRNFKNGSKFEDKRINPWELALSFEGLLAFASQTANRLDGLDSGSAAVPFAVRASNVGYASAAEEGFRLELWLPVWSQPLNAKKLKRLFARGRSRLDDKPAKNGLEFARTLPQLARRTGIKRLERYGIIERASEQGNTWACHLGTFFTKQDDVTLISQAERWVKSFNSRLLKERYFETLTGRRRLEDFVIDLGESFVRADRSPSKFKDIRRPQLDKEWADRLLEENNCPEVRLAIALSHAWSFSPKNKEQEKLNHLLNHLLPWGTRDLESAAIAASQNWAIYASQHKNTIPQRFRPYARLDDLAQFLRLETDDDRIWKLARGLRVVQANKVDLGFQRGNFSPGFEAIAICWHWCELWRDSKKDPKIETFKYEGQILSGLSSGRSRIAMDAALRRLRGNLSGLTDTSSGNNIPTLQRGYDLPLHLSRRWAAALAFPLSNSSISVLTKNLLNLDKSKKQ
ncbi:MULTISPECIES: type I-U CRISPR-associated protein Csx17 [Spirulina sp. CCY15215]|uniref:type I-G CRISPR-associated protein Cas8g1/Csx17 n=1 Tax=Spirulina sp. CCY15215 TaxID=2767591 RepID=UPI00194E9F70|nr:type I-U CRISPR-associated protein Csx17 [Spirulina major]